jgi:hypothetical protein
MATHRARQGHAASHSDGRPKRFRRLFGGLATIWGAGAVAAVLLTLGVNGTLASWTQAVIGNSSNTVASAAAVILQETGPGPVTCTSSSSSTNSATCSTINKYGGTATPLTPNTSQTVTVTFTNTGAANAHTSFVLAPGTCASTYTVTATGETAGAASTPSLCTNGDLTVAISCSDGATYSSGSAWTDLVYTAAAPPTATKTHTPTGTDLNAGASWTCQFTIALSSAASVLDQNITVSQPLTWTLNE